MCPQKILVRCACPSTKAYHKKSTSGQIILDLSTLGQEMLFWKQFCEDSVSVKVRVCGQVMLFSAAI